MKKKITLDDHRRIGLCLKKCTVHISEVLVKLGKHYPFKAPVNKNVVKLFSLLDNLRSDLDDLAAEENPKEFFSNIYYGQLGDKQ